MFNDSMLFFIQTGGWTVITFIGGIVYSLYLQQVAMKSAMVAMLRGHIVEIYTHSVLIRKYTTLYEHDAMTGLYSQYKKLKGNGSIDKIYAAYDKLPIHVDEEGI